MSCNCELKEVVSKKDLVDRLKKLVGGDTQDHFKYFSPMLVTKHLEEKNNSSKSIN
ncbi:hypothetical protein AGENTSMITH_139 [Bacillus phage vB_BspM_AgentSmith]|nr:hypothetical protein AGENTSMITH_139 [Bacillus phage vB_BspM_AgentSmith]